MSTPKKTIEDVRIPLRDGVELAAELHRPRVTSRGLLLVRTPYGRGRMFARMVVDPYVAHAYSVLFVSCRGTADSGGEFDPMRTETPDGHDTIAWMRAQPWYPGRFATVGGSYLGHTQWAVLADPPVDLVTSIISVGPHDFARHAWGRGTFNLDFIGWSDMVLSMGRGSALSAIVRLAGARRRLAPVLRATPIADAAVAHFGQRAPWMRDRLTRDDLSDPYWTPMRHDDALDTVTTPVLLITGWQDIFAEQSFEQYRRLHARGVTVGLTGGPWTHTEVGRAGGDAVMQRSLAWLDRHFAGEATPADATIRYGASGSKRRAVEWHESAVWPPEHRDHTLELAPGGRLVIGDVADAGAADRVDEFTYDPEDPTPTVGGPLIEGGGRLRDDALTKRSDVLAYTSDPLAADLLVVGVPQVTLGHRSRHPDADVLVRVSDVDGRGRSRNVTEQYTRLQGERDTPLVFDLRPVAHRFAAGHRIRLLLAGGSFPQFPRSTGTGENPVTATRRIPNQHTVALDESKLVLPVLD